MADSTSFAGAIFEVTFDMGEERKAEIPLSPEPTIIRDFATVANALLAPYTRQDISDYFPSFDPKSQAFLFKVQAYVVQKIRENIIADFRLVCKEHQILEGLELLSDWDFICDLEASSRIHPEKIAKEAALKRKLQEGEEMRRRLEQRKEEIRAREAQLVLLRRDAEKAENHASAVSIRVQNIMEDNRKLMMDEP
ncbi:hypothetical protein R1sor_018671 [Riccia sorocarpa]|uniref:Uncharacterized protein n=1 Tax=Riccia sorocarpa TaxID=122646 RepID=A0ABD3IDN7_9MARC